MKNIKIVYFTSDTCPICHKVNQVIIPWLEENSYEIEKVPTDTRRGELHQKRYKLLWVPAMFFVKDNIIKNILFGYHNDKTDEENIEIIQNTINEL